MTMKKTIADRETVVKNLLHKGIKVVGTTEEFDGSEGGIWLSAEEPQNNFFFDYYAESRTYELGIRKTFSDQLKSLGWYAEWQDPGTLILWMDCIRSIVNRHNDWE